MFMHFVSAVLVVSKSWWDGSVHRWHLCCFIGRAVIPGVDIRH